MKKLILIIFIFISTISNSQHYNTYYYNMPYGTIYGVVGIGSTTATTQYYYEPQGCYASLVRITWGTNNPPTQYSYDIPNPNGVDTEGTYYLTNLSASTKYYVLLKITNCMGEYYDSSPYEFTTIPADAPPFIVLNSPTNLTSSSVTLNANVTDDGGQTVTARGFYYGTTNPPMTQASCGAGTGAFYADISSLSANTLYYYYAYATNSIGTAITGTTTFTTQATGAVPTVSTTTATDITAVSANSGGNVTNDGGATVTERGVYYGTSANPTSGSSSGSGTGQYTISMQNLSSSTKYYYRAYAKNSYGTGYGTEYDFTTLAASNLPTVTTASTTNLDAHTATSGGNVTNQGGSSVTARGVVVSTTANPTLQNRQFQVNSGSGTGTFTSDLTGMYCNTTYHVRAFATNSYGTSYGDDVSFTTNNVTLSNFFLIYRVQANGNDITITDNTTAENACDLMQYSNKTVSSYPYKVTSATVGGQLYYYSSCAKASESGYFLIQISSTYYKVLLNSSGVIQSIDQCYP